jgi:hypothetical protein
MASSGLVDGRLGVRLSRFGTRPFTSRWGAGYGARKVRATGCTCRPRARFWLATRELLITHDSRSRKLELEIDPQIAFLRLNARDPVRQRPVIQAQGWPATRKVLFLPSASAKSPLHLSNTGCRHNRNASPFEVGPTSLATASMANAASAASPCYSTTLGGLPAQVAPQCPSARRPHSGIPARTSREAARCGLQPPRLPELYSIAPSLFRTSLAPTRTMVSSPSPVC